MLDHAIRRILDATKADINLNHTMQTQPPTPEAESNVHSYSVKLVLTIITGTLKSRSVEVKVV